MAFPSTLDTTSTIPVESSSTPLSTNHVANHTAMQTAIIAIETLLGVTASAVAGTFNYILGEITGSDKAVGKTATQTLTNKTLTAPTITGATITTSTVNGVTIQTGGSATDFLAANGTYQTGAVSNASTTAKGIVEVATSAEVTAGTATGSTGAALAITPDALAASTPVFNGSGLTNLPPVTYVTTASDNLKLSADTERTQTSSFIGTTYGLVKSFQLLNNGTIRLKMETKDASGNGGDARIYRNGTYIGTSHAGGVTYTAYSDDITGNATGDFIQVYTLYGGGQTTAIKNVRIYYDRTANILGTVVTD